MSAPTRNEKQEITRAKLKKAFQLAKAGHYDRARFILKPLQDHPSAKKMLAMMDGKQNKREKKKTFSLFRVILVIFVVVAIGGSIAVARFYETWLTNVGMLGLGGNVWALSDEELLYFDANNYCYIYTDFNSDSCEDWAQNVVDNHQSVARPCFEPYADVFFLDETQFIDVRGCLRDAGIPNPT